MLKLFFFHTCTMTTPLVSKKLKIKKPPRLVTTTHQHTLIKMSCVVCDNTKFVIVCPNGHKQCSKCLLKRLKAIYAEGRQAFNDDDAQRCFMCRCDLKDDLVKKFCPKWDTMCQLVIAQGMTYMTLKNRGYSHEFAFKQSNDGKELKRLMNVLGQ